MDKKRLLVILDPNDKRPLREDPALVRSVFFAREMGMVLSLLLVQSPSGFIVGPNADQSMAAFAAAQSSFMRFAEDLAAETGLLVSADLLWHRHQYEAILERAEALRPAYVIKATHHDTSLNRTFFNYTDWYLIRNCSFPLLLVKCEDNWSTRRVVACVNPAHVHSQLELLDNVIIEASQGVAYRMRGELHIFHAVETWPNPLEAVVSGLPEEELATAVTERHMELVEELLRHYGLGTKRLHMPVGRAERMLLPLVQELDASLVVMGAVSRGTIGSLLIGNTAERVLDALHCDVLVVKATPAEVKASVPAFDCVPT